MREKVDRKLINDAAELKAVLKSELLAILNKANDRRDTRRGRTRSDSRRRRQRHRQDDHHRKARARLEGAGQRRSLLCAADTFRAAAIEQLEVWAQRTDTELIKTKPGGDPSAVLFDAMQAAKARGVDYVIVDTAGRLHNKASLMAELDKMRRTAQRIIPGAPHETLLVMDATTGQNGLQQARVFTESAGVTGIVLTKLDGTAKGGVVVAISRELGLPVRYVGVGEKQGDLLPFNANDFVDSLFSLRAGWENCMAKSARRVVPRHKRFELASRAWGSPLPTRASGRSWSTSADAS
jgi:fused signal recognition particle receptor